MARPKNDGKGRLGGRKPGTPNKNNAAVKTAIAQVVTDYLTPATPATTKAAKVQAAKYTLEQDLAEMLPEQRARLITGLAGYVIPKQQALSIEDQTKIEAEALTQWLETAPEDAIDAIAAKVLELQAKARGERSGSVS